MKASELFALPPSLVLFERFFPSEIPGWEWISRIKTALEETAFEPSFPAQVPSGLLIRGKVFIHPSVKLPHVGTIEGPVWIGAGCELRPGVFIRGNVIVGEGCVLGNSCEFKNALLMDKCEVPHFSYVGDSILGNRAHLGAGVILSNLRLDRSEVTVRLPEVGVVKTGLRKFGALLGESAEVGCNAVLQPGTILGRRSLVMPTLAFGGVLPEATIAKVAAQNITISPRRD